MARTSPKIIGKIVKKAKGKNPKYPKMILNLTKFIFNIELTKFLIYE